MCGGADNQSFSFGATGAYPDACENITSRFMAQKRIEYWVYMIQVCMWSPTHTINVVVVVGAT